MNQNPHGDKKIGLVKKLRNWKVLPINLPYIALIPPKNLFVLGFGIALRNYYIFILLF